MHHMGVVGVYTAAAITAAITLYSRPQLVLRRSVIAGVLCVAVAIYFICAYFRGYIRLETFIEGLNPLAIISL